MHVKAQDKSFIKRCLSPLLFTGGGPDRHGGIPGILDGGLHGPQRHRVALLLRSYYEPLRVA